MHRTLPRTIRSRASTRASLALGHAFGSATALGLVALAVVDVAACKQSVETRPVASPASACNTANGLPPGEVRRVVWSHLGQVRACYERALEEHPGVSGSVLVSWHITSTGGVSRSVVTSSTLGSERFDGCITRVVNGWTFLNPDAVESDACWGFGLAPPS